MKIAVFSDHGVGRYFAQLFDDVPGATIYLSERNKAGLDVTPREKVVLTDRGQAGRILRHPLVSYRRWKENGFDRKIDFYFHDLATAAADRRFDVAITGGERALYTLASLKARGADFKLVYWIPFTIPFVDMFAERSFRIRQFAFPHVDRFIAITETAARNLAFEGVEPARVSQIYPGIDLQEFRPRPKPATGPLDPGRFNVIFVGKLASWKGCYTLLYATKLLVERIPNLHVTLIGRGAQQAGLERVARLMGIDDRVTFAGFIAYDRISHYYNGADVFVLPALPAINLAEQFGFVVAEAMASGVPAVVSRVGGLPEVVGGRDELLFIPGNYAELAERIAAIHDNPSLRDELARHCLDRARQHFDAKKNGRRVHELATSLVAQSCLP